MKKLKAKGTAKTQAPGRGEARPNIVGPRTFSADEIRRYVDPGPPEEAERLVRLIYEERRQDRERVLPE